MAITYAPTTNFGLKDSLPTNDSDKVIRGSEFTTEFTAIQTAFSLAAPNASPTFTGTVTIPTADINGGNIDGTVIGAVTPAAASFTTVSATGNITVGGTVDGRDVAADGTKLDGIEAGADVTDTTNVTAAGALMDSELTNIAAVKALNQGVATTDSPSFAGLTATGSVSLAGASTSADITFGDSNKAIFGAESDLEIYHSGTHSIINETGTGELKIQATNLRLQSASGGENYLTADLDGAVRVYYDDAQKFQTTATGIDVTGTVTADGLTVDGATTLDSGGAAPLTITRNAGASANLGIAFNSATNDFNIGVASTSEDFVVGNSSNLNTLNRLRVGSGGDISFYEDTGTTPKFFWDASAEALGIGTTSPTAELTIASTEPEIRLSDTNDLNSEGHIRYNVGVLTLKADPNDAVLSSSMRFEVDGSEAMRIDDSGNVGIGTSSPDGLLKVRSGSSPNAAQILIGYNGTSENYFDANTQIFRNGAFAEKARLDASGNLLVGKTSTTYNDAGTQIGSDGRSFFTADGNYAGAFNRLTSDGEIIRLSKDGTTVGSIGSKNSDMYIGSTNSSDHCYIRFAYNSTRVVPATNTGEPQDNALDLGDPAVRFKDLYLSGGVYLGGTGAANLLDDYETGTWTPAQSATWNFSQNLSSSSGTYVKIGNVVYVYAQLVLAGASTPTGTVVVSGLPFSSAIAAPGSYTSNDAANSKAYGNLYATTTFLVMYDAVSGTTSNTWNLSAVYTV